ncbi:hypothetical protein CBR_g3017 [Chara braunii]|uniref:Uncharacterized protein n=1 Tax=Chara braunii TaxID=69332 RepID=A0A388KEI8_CHABU|nr:hypothetical protein CBR_g3017 [Chara braunii]|eukprot:GBG68472.1 hypothetical protein CBR_g3017 [Chara braunii]
MSARSPWFALTQIDIPLSEFVAGSEFGMTLELWTLHSLTGVVRRVRMTGRFSLAGKRPNVSNRGSGGARYQETLHCNNDQEAAVAVYPE